MLTVKFKKEMKRKAIRNDALLPLWLEKYTYTKCYDVWCDITGFGHEKHDENEKELGEQKSLTQILLLLSLSNTKCASKMAAPPQTIEMAMELCGLDNGT